jgi:hypothetical protein
MSNIPPLPEGYSLREKDSNAPPLPEGYSLRSQNDEYKSGLSEDEFNSMPEMWEETDSLQDSSRAGDVPVRVSPIDFPRVDVDTAKDFAMGTVKDIYGALEDPACREGRRPSGCQ